MVFNFRAIFLTLNKVVFFTNFVRLAQDPDPHLDPDPRWEEQLDPDPQKINADPTKHSPDDV